MFWDVTGVRIGLGIGFGEGMGLGIGVGMGRVWVGIGLGVWVYQCMGRDWVRGRDRVRGWGWVRCRGRDWVREWTITIVVHYNDL